MITELFSELTRALQGSFQLALGAAFLWGVLSILLSPCHLSSIPLIIGYITSRGEVTARRSFAMSTVFAVGILVTIALIGAVTAYMGRLMGDVGTWGNWLVAGIFFLVGLYLLDVIKLNWGGFSPQPRKRSRSWPGALALGLIFGVGLGPCTFAYMAPVLGIVFHVSQQSLLQANSLLLAFGIGHIAVIVAAGTAGQWVQRYLNWSEDSSKVLYLKRACGVLVMLGGVYLVYSTQV